MILRPRRSKLTDTLCPYPTLFRSPVSLYYEPLIAAIDSFWKALAPILPSRLPAGHQRTVGATFISGLTPETGELRSEEHTSELQSLMRISYAVFCLKTKTRNRSNKHKIQ